MLTNGYRGAFAIGLALEDPWMEEFKSTRYPTALLDNSIAHTPFICNISTDSDEGIELAVEHLIELGHTRIAFLNGSTQSYISNCRMKAYLASMSRHHLPLDPALAIYSYFIADAAHYHVPNLINAGATAIICGNDLIASGVIDSLKKLNLSVPDDVSVIGFDDIPLATELNPPLTTIRQDRLALGRNGYFVLQAMLSNVSQSTSLLRPKLIVRSSTSKALVRPALNVEMSSSLKNTIAIDKDSVLYQNPSLFSGRY
jgi:LacI family transcriptional regulator